ncbi:hypothetical protein K2P47_04735 [Patescibacteria group bacterium]|nr:hypothetical protein [Patescibacteria group bacterium]
MFPSNWFETILSLLLVLATGILIRYLRRQDEKVVVDEEINYSSGTELGPAKAESRPKDFGTAKDHPHHRS